MISQPGLPVIFVVEDLEQLFADVTRLRTKTHQDVGRRGGADLAESKEKMFGSNILVSEPLRFGGSFDLQGINVRRGIFIAVHRIAKRTFHNLAIDAQILERSGGKSLRLTKKHEQHVDAVGIDAM